MLISFSVVCFVLVKTRRNGTRSETFKNHKHVKSAFSPEIKLKSVIRDRSTSFCNMQGNNGNKLWFLLILWLMVQMLHQECCTSGISNRSGVKWLGSSFSRRNSANQKKFCDIGGRRAVRRLEKKDNGYSEEKRQGLRVERRVFWKASLRPP